MKQIFHQTYNLTPFVAEFSMAGDRDGREMVVGMLKATFCFDVHGLLTVPPRERMMPVLKTDEYYDRSDNSGIRYPSDLTPEKEGTDIIINGHVYGHDRKQVHCGFKLGHLEKTLRVSGDRVWTRILQFYKIIGPSPFDKIPLVYENAFGGRYEDKKGSRSFEYNPLGKGYGAKYHEKPLLPNIEYTDRPVRLISHRPKPAGLGAIPMSWKQRRILAGTFDETWRAHRFPLAPLDMDPRFYNAVPEDQIFRPKLKGREKLVLQNLHRSNPRLVLTIPRLSFTFTARIKQAVFSQPMSIDTCLVEPDEHRLILTFVSRILLDSDSKYLKSVHFEEVK
jgi:hypothetical protein